jgi:FixJ family two-component response regulator
MPSIPRAPGRARLIAVVDDHESTRTTLCRLLERHGYAACHFGSVAEFVHSNQKSTIACLLSDVRMPGIDGIALHEGLRHTNFDFPVIFCTGHEPDERLGNALANGAFALLRKPIDAKTLIQTIEAACAKGGRATK